MAWYDNLIGSQTGNLLAGLGGFAAQNEAIKDIRGLGKDATTAIYGQNYTVPQGGLIGEIDRQSTFKPFGVTTATGSRAGFSSTGNLDTSLSPTEQALQERMLGFGSRAFGFLDDPAAREQEQGQIIGMLTQDPTQRAAREQQIMGNLTALQAPEQERQRLALEERLFGQGRTGVRTGMFGGTPEQLALEKAIQEQQAGSALTAMEQARAEQALTSQQTLAGLGETRNRFDLLGQLGLQSLPAAYQGQNQLLANLNPALDAFRTSQALRATGLTTGAGLAESGLEAQLGFEGLAASLRQQQFQGLFDLLKGEQAAAAAPAAGGTTQLTGNAAIDAAIAMYGGIPRNSGTTLTGNDAVDAAIAMYGGIPRG
jgi:hypothetical protein